MVLSQKSFPEHCGLHRISDMLVEPVYHLQLPFETGQTSCRRWVHSRLELMLIDGYVDVVWDVVSLHGVDGARAWEM